MSLYPSLEDLKVDRLEKAQINFESQILENRRQYQHSVPAKASTPGSTLNEGYAADLASGPLYPNLEPTAPPPSYNVYSSSLPYPVSPDANAHVYPMISDYMGLELTAAVIAANMPQHLNSQPQFDTTAVSQEKLYNNTVAPLSGKVLGLKRAQISQGIREVTLCKDSLGMIGLRVVAVNNGVFVCLVKTGTPASLCGVRFGDQILEIDGISVAGYSMSQVHDLFRNCGVNNIKVLIRERPFERTVTLHKDSLGHVGFRFKNGEIIGLIKDSSAAKNGVLTEHQLLEVDGQNVIGLKDKVISTIMENSPKIVTITIIPTFIYLHMIKKMNVNLVKSSMDHSIPDI